MILNKHIIPSVRQAVFSDTVTHLLITTTLCSGCCCYTYFTAEKIEVKLFVHHHTNNKGQSWELNPEPRLCS